jgi:hypothetical protein
VNTNLPKNFDLEERYSCPYTRLSILRKREWTNIHMGENYRITLSIIEDNIVWFQPSGYASRSGIERTLRLTDDLLVEVIPRDGPHVQIDDWSELDGASRRSCRIYINNLKKRKRLKALIIYGTSAISKLAIRLGKCIKILKFPVKTVDDYAAAVRLGQQILTSEQTVNAKSAFTETCSPPYSFNQDDNFNRRITKQDWEYIDNNFSLWTESRNCPVPEAYQIQQYVDELLEFINQINWEVDGINKNQAEILRIPCVRYSMPLN